MASRATIIISTFPTEESVASVAKKVVGNRLCACVNFTKVRSIYSWHGKTEDQAEFIALFKTSSKSAKKLKIEIAKMHPYDVPEIVELKMNDVSKPYLVWLLESSDSISKKRHHTPKR